ncbi:hypothetical protein XW81_00025 [Buchnera aphidicola (Schlechtendalia chinensis)]|uniref:ATP synthase subunit b n=1 Tax=Buchnera aphidicola subsp. Schlechtendalia chinensis TaxID=118110 RepID=A0A172WCZ3_BUCSC|nr:F0F1 ATP synthase subunit B [Buchnera aphidicola]ANF16831.1 hypothetical protein XW81_00025 [Buchnera aphidicola (Schlechtendalia chinensis)]
MSLNATILGQAVSFLLFTFFCMKYIWPSIMLAINTRQNEISSSLLNIENGKKDLDSYREKILNETKNMKKDINEMMNQAMQKKILILQKAYFEAQQEKEKILNQTKLEIELEYQKLKCQLVKEISQISLSVAEKIIRNKNNGEIMENIINSLSCKL